MFFVMALLLKFITQLRFPRTVSVLRLIRNLNYARSLGTDKIFTMFVKNAACAVWEPFVLIYNSSIESGLF